MPRTPPRKPAPKRTTPSKPRAAKAPAPVRGACGCGAVQFTVTGTLSDVVWCHCSKCQRFHGGPGPYTSVARAGMQFSRRDGLAWWDVSRTVQRGFCKVCGASLLFSDSNASTVSLCAGALEHPTGLRSARHVFVGSKPDWYELGADGLLRSNEG